MVTERSPSTKRHTSIQGLYEVRSSRFEDYPWFVFVSSKLRTGKAGVVEEFAAKVSDPRSPSYGKYLTRQQLREMIAAPVHVEEAVVAWLREASSDPEIKLYSHGDAIQVRRKRKGVGR